MPTLNTTLGQLLINSALPAELVDHERVLDKRGVKELLQQVAEQYPEKYREVSKQMADVGRHAAYTTGGHSFGLKSLRPAVAGRLIRLEMQSEINKILASGLSEAERNKQIIAVAQRVQPKLVESVLNESKDEGNPLALQLLGAGRGNPHSLNSLRGADLLYADHRGDPIPIPVMRSYSEGLSPVEYFAGAFGARKGIFDLKAATADAGFFGKQLSQMAHRLLVTGVDDDEPYDEAMPRGFPIATDDPDNEGGFLSHPVAGYPRNTLLTPRILKDIRSRGFDEILVRSPTVGGPLDGGVYSRDVGYREKGGLAPQGDYVGIAAAQSLSEPLTQAQISSKHSGGVAGAGAGAISGFKLINNLVQVPEHFPGGAVHAQRDGRVQKIVAAPQGGHYVTVNGEQHYVPVNRDLLYKAGDEVEAGDVLSSGVPNPAQIVQHKGIGEGRRYFVEAFRKAMKDSSTFGHRRNIELISRGLINHVKLNDEVGDWSPGDTVPYQVLERQWRPRDGAITATPREAVGHFLERPALHYTVGTRVTPKMVTQLGKHGVTNVQAHRDAPPFEPHMVRGMANIGEDPDWMTRFLGSYQQRSLSKAVHRGDISDEAGTSFVPSLARGETFGLEGPTKGWKPTL